jgi:RNA polymerase sigma factor (sigma-70 family)
VDNDPRPVVDRAEGEYSEWFVGLSPRALRVALRITGNRQDAEDAVIEAFGRAFARWNRLRSKEWRDGWVLTVTSNLALDEVRRQRKQRLEHPVGDVCTAGDSTTQIEEVIVLIEALKALPRRQREVAVLIHGAGLTHLEASAKLGIGIGSTKTHLHRATRRLQILMAPKDL